VLVGWTCGFAQIGPEKQVVRNRAVSRSTGFEAKEVLALAVPDRTPSRPRTRRGALRRAAGLVDTRL